MSDYTRSMRRAFVGVTGKPVEEFDRWIAEMKATALDRAADSWLHGAWGKTPRRADRIADRMAASQFAGDWLRSRAAEYRKTEPEGK